MTTETCATDNKKERCAFYPMCKHKKFVPQNQKGCGKKYQATIIENDRIRIGTATCDGIGEIPLCPECQNQSLTEWKCKECGSTKKYTHKDICHKCYMRDWIKTPKAKTYAEKYDDKNANKRKRDWEKKNPEKRLAQEWARANIKIIGLCQLCKEHNAEERHHFDYSKPKEVNLLCKRCHYNLHKMLRDNRGYNG